MKLSYLVIYAVVMCFMAVRTFIKKYNPIYRSLWTLYALSAVFCVICKVNQRTLVGSGIMQTLWYDLSDTTLKAYILLIICSIIAFEPLREFDHANQLAEFGRDKKMKNFFTVYSIIYLSFAVIFIFTSLGNILGAMSTSDYGELRSSLANGENEMSAELASNAIANMCYKLCFHFRYLSVFIAFGSLKEKTNKFLSALVLVVTFFIVYITNAVIAGRGSFMIFAFATFLIGLCFYKYLSKSARRKLVIGGVIAAVPVLGYFVTVSMSRVEAVGIGNAASLLYGNMAFYMGHGPIEFSKITGSLTDFAYGETIIGRMISHYFGTNYSWETIANQIGYPNIGPVYNTYLGYLYTDFGSIGCILFTSVWSYFIYRVVKKRPKNISTFFLLTYYLHFYATGNFVIGRLEYVRVVTTIIIYLIIRLVERSPELRRVFTLGLRIKLSVHSGTNSRQKNSLLNDSVIPTTDGMRK